MFSMGGLGNERHHDHHLNADGLNVAILSGLLTNYIANAIPSAPSYRTSPKVHHRHRDHRDDYIYVDPFYNDQFKTYTLEETAKEKEIREMYEDKHEDIRREDFRGHIALINLAKHAGYEKIKTEIAMLKPLKELEPIDRFKHSALAGFPQNELDENIFDSIYSNEKLLSNDRITLYNLLISPDKGYGAYSYKLLEFPLLNKVDSSIASSCYQHAIALQRKLEKPQESKIWEIISIHGNVNELLSLTKTLLAYGHAQKSMEFIKNWIDTLQSPTACIEFYNSFHVLLNQSELKDLDTYINKMVKDRILAIEINTNPKDLAPAIAEEKFLNTRRPSQFQFFTQLFNTSSAGILDQVKKNQLGKAKSLLAKKEQENKKKLEEKLEEHSKVEYLAQNRR